MRLLRAIQERPIVLLSVIGTGFGTWLVLNAIVTHPGSEPDPSQPVRTFPMPLDFTGRVPVAQRPAVITADLMSRLHPGMTRVDVEGLVGPPPAAMVQPVTNVDGRLTYRANYLANLESDVRQHQETGSSQPVPPTVISLEFDATRPGHPLVKVHLPHPMS